MVNLFLPNLIHFLFDFQFFLILFTFSFFTGKPRPSLTWWRDDTIIDDSFEYNDKDGE